jgi:RNA polymerase sigma-70 factor (ECF subfamily)
MDGEDHVKRRELSAALVRAAKGDRAALRQIYEATSAKLFGICLRILKDRSEAEEVLQEVYLTIWRKAQSYDPDRASPITWLVTIARNRSIDRLRAGTGRLAQVPIDWASEVHDESPDASERIVQAQERAKLQDCLGALDLRQSDYIRAAFLDGATYDQLAIRAAVPLGTMKSLIRRTLLKLRACLET